MSTICAIATATGGSIGIVRVSGPEAINITNIIFRSHRPITEVTPYTIHHGKIMDNEQVIDDVLVSVFRAPNSYTGEDCTEISCHGSSFILQKVLSLLISNGCVMAQPGEYTKRAFLNGKMDLSQAEAVADLIASDSEAAHRIAMTHMRGGISKELAILRDELLQMTSLLELELDFSEEDIEFANRNSLINLAQQIETEISRLVNSFTMGNAIKNGVAVAIIGAPNVGKSTLLNQLLHEERAIVSDIQGTTRDTIEDIITISGITFRFIDTAGIRHTDNAIERIGIERALSASEKAQIIILMTEPEVPFPDINIQEHQKIIRITNKTENFQALTGKGIEWLESELLECVGYTGTDDVVIANVRHKQALESALLSIRQAISGITFGIPSDLVAEDLRQCLNHLAEILGSNITTEDVLSNIFCHFCIGK